MDDDGLWLVDADGGSSMCPVVCDYYYGTSHKERSLTSAHMLRSRSFAVDDEACRHDTRTYSLMKQTERNRLVEQTHNAREYYCYV